jgi:hypothetical protein
MRYAPAGLAAFRVVRDVKAACVGGGLVRLPRDGAGSVEGLLAMRLRLSDAATPAVLAEHYRTQLRRASRELSPNFGDGAAGQAAAVMG